MDLRLTDALQRAEHLFGSKIGVVCGDVRLSYLQFAARCRRLATLLQQMGVGHSDRVALLMPNCHRYLEAFCAIPGIGAVIVPLNTRHTIAEHRTTLADCGARLLIVDEQFAHVADALNCSDVALLVAPTQYEQRLTSCAETSLGEGITADDLAALFYTGGTTGAAKGVMLTHRNLVANAFNITIGFGYQEHDSFLHAAPLFHLADAGSIHALIWQGARHVILPTFDPGAVLDQIAREHITCTVGVPTMINALIHHPRVTTTDLSSLRLIAHGGAPITPALLRRAVATLGCSFTQAYGLTEASSFAGVLPHEERLLDDRRIRSVGRPAMGVELVVRCPDGAPCKPDEVGEITGRGPNFTEGYWRRPDATAEALRDGWFWTGDLATMDAEGYLYLVDRVKDMIISGGENVYSTEVEAVIAEHPVVAEAAIIGVPDDVWGERVHAVVVVTPGHTIDLAEIRGFCHERIAGYKCPRSLELVAALPTSGAGKVLKRELRALHGADVAQSGA